MATIKTECILMIKNRLQILYIGEGRATDDFKRVIHCSISLVRIMDFSRMFLGREDGSEMFGLLKKSFCYQIRRMALRCWGASNVQFSNVCMIIACLTSITLLLKICVFAFINVIYRI